MSDDTATPVPTAADIIQLHADIDQREAAIAAAKEAVQTLEQRRQTLQARLDELNSEQPRGPLDGDDAIVLALAADPSLMPTDAEMADARDRRSKARIALENWQAGVSLLQQAIARVDGDIDQANAQIQPLEENLASAWPAFARAAHNHLFAGFRAEFERIMETNILPMLALIAPQPSLRTPLVREDWRLSKMSFIDIERDYIRGFAGDDNNEPRWSDQTVRLFHGLQDGHRTDHAAHLKGFRDALREQAARKKPVATRVRDAVLGKAAVE